MYEPLFDGRRQVSNVEVIQKMKEYIKRANELMGLNDNDPRAMVALAHELRKEFREEYRNNKLQRIKKEYKDHELFFSYYKPAIEDAYVKTTGQLTQRKAFSFLYDIDSYMNYYMPRKYRD